MIKNECNLLFGTNFIEFFFALSKNRLKTNDTGATEKEKIASNYDRPNQRNHYRQVSLNILHYFPSSKFVVNFPFLLVERSEHFREYRCFFAAAHDAISRDGIIEKILQLCCVGRNTRLEIFDRTLIRCSRGLCDCLIWK